MGNLFLQKLCGMAALGTAEMAALRDATANPSRYAARQDLFAKAIRPAPYS